MVDVVFKITLRLFVKKSRSLLCEKIKDGGLNAQQLRRLIMSNLQGIQTKLAGLARGSLLTSASNLQEGLRLLDALVTDEPNTPTISRPEGDKIVEDNPDGARQLERGSSSEDSLLKVNAALALIEAIDKIKFNSSDHFVSAMKLFENANTEATRAFHNEALSVEDRVLATKLRVQSRILLSLENPSLAEQPCRLYLEELHGLSSLVETFRIYLKGGIMSKPNKKKRHKLVLSVTTINFVVLNFLKRFSKDPIILFDWPSLQVDSWMYNPVISDKTIFAEMQSIGGFLFPNLVFFDLGKRFDASTLDVRSFCVNSVGDLILKDPSNHCEVEPPFLLKIITSESEVKSFSQMSFLHGQIPLAIDSNDNVYYLSTFGDSFYTDSPAFLSAPSCELIALDSNGLSKDSYEFGECVGMFSFNAMNSTPCGFAVAIRREGSSVHEVTLFENDEGRIKKTSSFQTQLWNFTLITVTSKYQVVAAEKSGHYVRVYEKDGQMIREFELYGGDNESCVSVAFNHLTGEVIFITLVRRCYFLSTYIAETGERRRKIRLSLFGDDEEVHLTSHCKGPIAIVSPQLVLYLQ